MTAPLLEIRDLQLSPNQSTRFTVRTTSSRGIVVGAERYHSTYKTLDPTEPSSGRGSRRIGQVAHATHVSDVTKRPRLAGLYPTYKLEMSLVYANGVP